LAKETRVAEASSAIASASTSARSGP